MRMLALAAVLAALAVSPAFAGNPIPEPASMALLAAGIGGVAIMKFRRRK